MDQLIKRQIGFILQLLLLTTILLGIHWYLLSYFYQKTLFFPIWHIYLFHSIVTLLFFSIISYKFSKGNKVIFNLFMGLTLVKMLLAIIFLLPLFFSEIKNKQADIFNFFIPYFVYLFFEVFSISRFLKKT